LTPHIFETLTVGPLEENCYLVGDPETREAVCIDPGAEGERIVEAIRRHGLTIHAILVTHAHADHIMAAPDVKAATGAPVIAPEGEQELWSMAEDFCAFWGFPMPQPPDPDRWATAGETLEWGSLRFETLDVRGHSPASLAYLSGGAVFPGDALFRGSIGRTDLPGQDFDTLIDRIRTNLLSLTPGAAVYPGHGPATSIGEELRENPFLRATPPGNA
jgi:glyoxylase-like metal-dependent hydrolase (beta-lactamase superfamily II)